MFQALFITPWPWYVAGPLIGLYAVAFLYFKNHALGASSAYQAVLEAVEGKGDPEKLDLSGKTLKIDLPIDPREKAPRWRIWWMAGLLVAGLVAWALGGDGTGSLNLPGMPEFFHGWSLGAMLGLLFIGGIFIGFGTRMSGGCTSGHAITGISNLQLPSVYATCVFFAVGMAVSFFMRWWLS